MSQAVFLYHKFASILVSFRYFGRAKDLPGVRELFQSKKKEEDEENLAQTYYKKFTNQGPAYFGDLDEQDGSLLDFERQAEENSASYCLLTAFKPVHLDVSVGWKGYFSSHLKNLLFLPADSTAPPIPPRSSTRHTNGHANGDVTPRNSDSKRKAPEGDVEMAIADVTSDDLSKRPKMGGVPPQTNGDGGGSAEDAMLAHARATAAYIPFLSPEHLLPPELPSREEMEQFLLDLRKKALVEEYFGDAQ